MLSVEHPYERASMRFIIALLIALSCAYLYFVSSSVLHVMSRKEALTESSRIQAAIGTLEGDYFSLSQSITPESAAKLGLVPMQSPDYVKSSETVGMAAPRPSAI